MSCDFDRKSGSVQYPSRREEDGISVRTEQLQRIAGPESVALRQVGVSERIAGFHHGDHIIKGKVTAVPGGLTGLTVVEPGGLGPVAQLVDFIPPDFWQRDSGDGTVQGMAVRCGR